MNYKKSKFFLTSGRKKIKYLYLNKKSQITVVFFHGFMSNMIGKKPTAIKYFCEKKKLNFLKFEYSGHGKSSGNFTEGNISKWTEEAKQLIKSKTNSNCRLIFVGSSMGSWIALNLFSTFKKKIIGFMGIASAPEFLENLMWKKLDKKIKKIILCAKVYQIKHGLYTYPLTKQLIFDGRKNKILHKKINLKLNVALLHGSKDDVVPLSLSKKILRIFTKAKKKLVKIKNGDHSLSKKDNLKKICQELDIMISDYL